jgi:type IV secretory pathway VirJ component
MPSRLACVRGTCRQTVLALAALAALAALVGLAACASAGAEEFPKPDAQGTVEVSLKPAHTLILFLSGDGGWWGDIDAQLANRLAREGYAVLGIDTDIWFGPERTPDEVAAHLSELADQYAPRVHASRIALIGYSYGADMIPLALRSRDAVFGEKLAAIVLIAPERETMMQVTLLEQSGIDPGDIVLAPAFAALPRRRTVCVYGESEQDDTGCTEDALKGTQLIGLPGGHHFGDDIKTLGDKISAAIHVRARP